MWKRDFCDCFASPPTFEKRLSEKLEKNDGNGAAVVTAHLHFA
jgi:hypothetical protein